MLMPKKTKFRKQQRGRMRGVAKGQQQESHRSHQRAPLTLPGEDEYRAPLGGGYRPGPEHTTRSPEHRRALQLWDEEREFGSFIGEVARTLGELYYRDIPRAEKLRLREEVLGPLLERHPRFRQRVVPSRNPWRMPCWEYVDDFAIDEHIGIIAFDDQREISLSWITKFHTSRPAGCLYRPGKTKCAICHQEQNSRPIKKYGIVIVICLQGKYKTTT